MLDLKDDTALKGLSLLLLNRLSMTLSQPKYGLVCVLYIYMQEQVLM